MIIKYNESLRDARILARSGDSLRIALENGDDAVELTLVDGIWLSEEGKPVSFEFLLAPEIRLAFLEDGDRLPPRLDHLPFGHDVSDALRC